MAWLIHLIGLNFVQKDETVEFFRVKFAGSQADRVVKAEAEAQKLAEQLKETKVSGNDIVFLLPPFFMGALVIIVSITQFFFFFV